MIKVDSDHTVFALAKSASYPPTHLAAVVSPLYTSRVFLFSVHRRTCTHVYYTPAALPVDFSAGPALKQHQATR